jgi:hypothetical protein
VENGKGTAKNNVLDVIEKVRLKYISPFAVVYLLFTYGRFGGLVSLQLHNIN